MGEYVVSKDIEVRFRDTDAMGHVNNAVYLSYLEFARQTYWQRFEGGHDYAKVPFVVASLRIDFRSPLHVHEVARVFVRTTWISRSSFGMEYTVRERDGGRIVVDAESIQVTYDYGKQRAMPVPDWLRRELERVEGRPLPARPTTETPGPARPESEASSESS